MKFSVFSDILSKIEKKPLPGRQSHLKMASAQRAKILNDSNKFSKNPKPKNFTHSNKVTRIKQISYGTDSKFISILNELCDDETLQLFEGHGVKDVFYEK